MVVRSNNILYHYKDKPYFWVLIDTRKLLGALTCHKQSELLHCPSALELFLD